MKHISTTTTFSLLGNDETHLNHKNNLSLGTAEPHLNHNNIILLGTDEPHLNHNIFLPTGN